MITQKIGARIRELRTQLGISQEKFAMKIGMDRTYFASVELGKRNVSIVNIEKIANGWVFRYPSFFKTYNVLFIGLVMLYNDIRVLSGGNANECC